MTLTRQTRRQPQPPPQTFGGSESACCVQSPTTSRASAHHRLCGGAGSGAAATSTPLAAGDMTATDRRLRIQHISPIRSVNTGNGNVVILSAQRATQKFNAQMDASRRQDSSGSSCDVSFWSDTTIDRSPQRGACSSSGYISGGDVWPSVVNVLETPERRRLQAAAPPPPPGVISSIFSSPPLQRTGLAMKSASPQTLRTPRAPRSLPLAASVHISSSPMGAFFYRRNATTAGTGGVLASNENVTSSPISQKKFVGMRFSGSQISRPTETCLLWAERPPNASTDAFVDHAASENNSTAASTLLGAPAATFSGTDDSSHLSEDSGISTFFLSATSPSATTAPRDGGKPALNGFAVPLHTLSEFTSTNGFSSTVHVETPSKGLTTETDDCLLALVDTSKLFTLNMTPLKQLSHTQPHPEPMSPNFSPEIASGPLEADLFTALQRHCNAVSFSQHKRVRRLRRRGILRRPIGIGRSPRSIARSLVVYEEFDSQDLLSLEQLERLRGARAELIAVDEFFVKNRVRLVGESPDQIEVTALARLFFCVNRVKFTRQPPVVAPLEQWALDFAPPLFSRRGTLSAGPPDNEKPFRLDAE